MTKSCFSIDLDTLNQTRDAVADDPSAGRGAFTTVTQWEDGARARTTARSFVIDTDEPTPLGGTDRAIDPMELILASVGTCLSIGWVTHAAQRGVEFRDLRIEVTGDYDLNGYLGLDESVRPGFTGISYSVHVDTDADAAVLDEILEAAQAGSPMVDNVINRTSLTGAVVRSG